MPGTFGEIMYTEAEINPKFENVLDQLIYGYFFVLAMGLVTSTSILALSHLFMLIPALYFIKITNWKKLPKSAWALLGLSLAIMLSVIVNQEIMVKGWKPFFKVKYFLFGFFSIVPIHWWVNNKLDDKRKKILIYTFLISTTVATVSGLCGTFFGLNPLLIKMVKVGTRNGGLFGMLMNYAHNLSYFLVLVFGIILNREKLKHLVSSRIVIIFFIINLVGLYFSFTRGAWLAVIAGIPMYFYKGHKKVFWSLLVSLLIVGTVGFFVAGDQVIRPASEGQRISQWEAAYYAFKEKPVLGYGYLNFEDHSKNIKERYEIFNKQHGGHAHNNFMEVLASVGIIGTIAFLTWLVFWFREESYSWSIPLLTTFVVGGLTQATIALGINLFFIMAVYSVAASKTREVSPSSLQ